MKIDIIEIPRPQATSFSPTATMKPVDGDTIIVDPKLLGTKTKLDITLRSDEAALGINVDACDDLKYHPPEQEVVYLTNKLGTKSYLKYLKSQREDAIIKHTTTVVKTIFPYLKNITLAFYPVK